MVDLKIPDLFTQALNSCPRHVIVNSTSPIVSVTSNQSDWRDMLASSCWSQYQEILRTRNAEVLDRSDQRILDMAQTVDNAAGAAPLRLFMA